MSKYVVGQTYRRCDVGLAGRHKVIWLACPDCDKPRFTCARNPAPRCPSCSSKRMRRILDLNLADHKPDCKCYRCRIGKGHFSGPKNPMWNGGRFVAPGGYIAVWVAPDDPMNIMTWSASNRKNYCFEHRVVMARHIGRPLKRTEYVHHKNGVRDDNRIENLELWRRPHPAGVRVTDVEEAA